MTTLCHTCGNAEAVIEDYCVDCEVTFFTAHPEEFDPDLLTPWGTRFWDMSDAHKEAAAQIKAAIAHREAA